MMTDATMSAFEWNDLWDEFLSMVKPLEPANHAAVDKWFRTIITGYGRNNVYFYDLDWLLDVITELRNVKLGLHCNQLESSSLACSVFFSRFCYQHDLSASENQAEALSAFDNFFSSIKHGCSDNYAGMIVENVSTCLTETHIVSQHRADLFIREIYQDLLKSWMGSTTATYSAYIKDLRAEFAHLSDVEWADLRSQEIALILDEDRVFHTQFFDTYLGLSVKINLNNELAALNLTTLGRT